MTNKEIEDYLAEKGFEFIDVIAMDTDEGMYELYDNWRTQVILRRNGSGVKTLFREVTEA